MDEHELSQYMKDTSGLVTYQIGVNVQNMNLSPEQRRTVAGIMKRHALGLQAQLDMALGERCYVSLYRDSSKTGTTTIELGGVDG